MTDGRRGLTSRARLAALLLVVFLFGGTANSHAQSVDGVVLAGIDSSAVPAATVLLHRITAVAGEVVDSTQTDADGRFSLRIAQADTAAGILYAAAAVRGDVSYFGPILHAGVDTPDPYLIFVYETERIAAPVEENAVLLRHAVVSPTAHGLLQVAEVVDVAGVPGRALQMENASKPIWSMELPAGVQSWSPMEGGLAAEALSLVNGRVEARATLPPSGMRLSFSYYVEGSELEFPIEHETERFEVILVGANEGDLSGLRPGDGSDLPPGAGAKRFVGSEFQPGSRAGITVRSEPVSRGPVLTWVLIGTALLVAAGLSARAARRPAA